MNVMTAHECNFQTQERRKKPDKISMSYVHELQMAVIKFSLKLKFASIIYNI